MISRKQPITIPATSPPSRHVPEIEKNGIKEEELIKLMSLEFRQMRWGTTRQEVKNDNLIGRKERDIMGRESVCESHWMTLTTFSRDQSLKTLSAFLLSGRQIQGWSPKPTVIIISHQRSASAITHRRWPGPSPAQMCPPLCCSWPCRHTGRSHHSRPFGSWAPRCLAGWSRPAVRHVAMRRGQGATSWICRWAAPSVQVTHLLPQHSLLGCPLSARGCQGHLVQRWERGLPSAFRVFSSSTKNVRSTSEISWLRKIGSIFLPLSFCSLKAFSAYYQNSKAALQFLNEC